MPKSILVTGGTKGIGRAIIYRFAKEGFDIATCARNEHDLGNLKADLEAKFPEIKVLALVADLSKKEEVARFSAQVKGFCKPDVLINNTGVFLPGSIYNEPEGNFELMMHTNLFSAYYLIREFVPDMVKRKSGHIFSMGSIAGTTAYANGGSYAISKWAMLGMTKCLREEMKEHQVKVTSILPGATYTASWEGVDLPVERFMKSEDVAESVWGAYNLSPQSVVEELIIRPQLGDI
ncbi:SDR family oxidoreductase [Algoriphagus zhangzhouensis]|uniref:NADP-dependent 3-hydroxy acid dehydrogenase YdfG n=1 Tax=Algoriphagus zhangzhouensis TaxID=1073327 RepID=A0A1M7ZKE9_9BACT|nr:SDR family oxidoreductase [Algoriphagus zhangzhouensis]TDY43151.1 NADP-dependent 3-hydroxy acid dehydrogenase YdfG [Algoriphagus zhangzhouensis]SHO65282.1 NADP-dependent 3-hydroxy acid dehydrogenase YdfG [Algoriphagus zhangzhouensis]